MKEYLMVFRNEASAVKPDHDSPEMQAVMKQWQTWISGIAAKGNFSGTNRLTPVGKTLRSGKPITDGPYVEAKEMIGGYLLVKANSLNDAIEMAKGCPMLTYGGNVEVREVLEIDSNPKSATFLGEKVQAVN